MSTRLGKDALITLYRPVYDADGRAVSTGAHIGSVLGRAHTYRLTSSGKMEPATYLGDEWRAHVRGLGEWDAQIEMFWNAQDSTYNQDELMALFTPDTIAARHTERDRLGVCFWLDGETAGAKEAFYGVACIESSVIGSAEADVVRLSVRLRGSDGLDYAGSLFTAGAVGAMEQYTFAQLEAFTFAQLETLAEP